MKEERRYVVARDEQLIREIIEDIRKKKIDVMVIDPYVASHRVSENDNSATELVAKAWAHIAEEANCSIMLVHHARKTNGEARTVEDGRGASALNDASRNARVVNTMNKDEAKSAGIEEHARRFYFRVDGGKTSMTKPAEFSDWFKLVSVDLENEVEFGGGSDEVGVVAAWKYPRPNLPMIGGAEIVRAQKAIEAGGPWRKNQQAADWVGIPIARTLNIDPNDKVQKKGLNRLVEDWLAAGYLVEVTGTDRNRKVRSYVEVGEPPPEEPIRATYSSDAG